MVVFAFSPSTQEMGRSLSSTTPWSGQSGQFQANSRPARDNREVLPQRKKEVVAGGEIGDGLTVLTALVVSLRVWITYILKII